MSNTERYLTRRQRPIPKEILEKVKIPPLKINCRGESFLERIHLSDPNLDEGNDAVFSISHKLSAQVLDMTDRILVNSIINAAEEEGVNDLFLIDKEFIISAIKNEMARRRSTDDLPKM